MGLTEKIVVMYILSSLDDNNITALGIKQLIPTQWPKLQ
jgi:hypothetical protein